MKPKLPGAPTMAAFVLAAMIAATLPLDLSKLQSWQTLTAACIAAAGVAISTYVAVRNVNRQLRINLLIREEDRMERTLPGLQQTVAEGEYLIRRIYASTAGVQLRHLFDESPRYAITGKKIENSPRSRLVNLDANTSRAYFQVYYNLADRAANCDRAEKHRAERLGGDIQKLIEAEAVAKLEFEESFEIYRKFIKTLAERVSTYETRLPRFRAQIEKYLS